MESESNAIDVLPELDYSCISKCMEACMSLCCCECCETEDKKHRYSHIQYRPISDFTQPLWPYVAAGERLTFPQSRLTVWPQHNHSTSVITEEPQSVSTSTLSRQASVRAKLSSITSASQFPSLPSPALPPPDLCEVQDTTEPTLTFALFYDMQMRVLRLHIKFASNLNALQPGHVHGKKCISCISAFLLPNKDDILQVFNRNIRDNPFFEKTLKFPGILSSDLRQQTLLIRIHDYRTLLGIVKVPLENTDLLGHTICRKIKGSSEQSAECQYSAGDIYLSLSYHPDVQIVRGMILRVANLRQPILHFSTPQPYVNVYFMYKGERYAKWKSSFKYDPSILAYSETFQFNLSKMELNLVMLSLHIKDYHRLALKHLIGSVEIGSSAESETGMLHWQEILQSPHHVISRWHTIVPDKARHQT